MILDSENFIRESVWLNAWISVAGCTSCHIASNASRWANICLTDFDSKFPEYRIKDNLKNKQQ